MPLQPYNLSTWISFHIGKFIGKFFRQEHAQHSGVEPLTEASESWKEYDRETNSSSDWLDAYLEDSSDAQTLRAQCNRPAVISPHPDTLLIGNRRTLIYHRPCCEWVQQMSVITNTISDLPKKALAAEAGGARGGGQSAPRKNFRSPILVGKKISAA